jgi:hypothetical protein
MNNSGLWKGVLIAMLVVSAAAMIGVGSYNAGVARGFVESGRAVAATPGAVPYDHDLHRHWGAGFFPIVPLLFFFFLFACIRGLWWGGPWRGGLHYRYHGVPPSFEEWHRRAHAQEPPAPKP